MLWLLALLITAASGVPADTVLVKDAPTTDWPATHGTMSSALQDGSVLGWRRVPADEAEGFSIVVPDVYLDLLGPTPATEPLARDQWALDTIDIVGAWAWTTGEPGAIVAVVDSGVEVSHPEFQGRIFTNEGEIPGNGVDDDGNDLVDDVAGWDVVDNDNDPTDTSVGHGTEVAGVATAALNGVGVAGVAPNVTLLPIRACSSRCELLDVAWGIVYAVDMGADIINLSLGGFAEPGPLTDALAYAEDAGVLVVAAAGNTGADIDGGSFVPASLPNANLLVAAATTRTDELWDGTNFGSEVVDIGAPGVEIVTTTISSLGGYRTVTGTSFASPYAAGVAALMLSADPDLTVGEVIETLTRWGAPLDSLAGKTVHGTRLRAAESVVAGVLTDVDSSPFVADVVWLGVHGLTRGCDPPANRRFCPDRSVTRAEMATFLRRFLHLPPGAAAFADDAESVHEADIDALAAAGITRGCNPPTNDHFCPDRPVTRGEMAAFLDRALGLAAGADAFTDDDTSPYETAINALAAAGVTRGCNPPANDHFCPDRPVTRGEMAALLHRADS